MTATQGTARTTETVGPAGVDAVAARSALHREGDRRDAGRHDERLGSATVGEVPAGEHREAHRLGRLGVALGVARVPVERVGRGPCGRLGDRHRGPGGPRAVGAVELPPGAGHGRVRVGGGEREGLGAGVGRARDDVARGHRREDIGADGERARLVRQLLGAGVVDRPVLDRVGSRADGRALNRQTAARGRRRRRRACSGCSGRRPR